MLAWLQQTESSETELVLLLLNDMEVLFSPKQQVSDTERSGLKDAIVFSLLCCKTLSPPQRMTAPVLAFTLKTPRLSVN